MRLPALTLALALIPLAPVALAPSATAATTTYHVATNGSDANPGSSTRPFKTVQRAVDAATPGSTLLVHAGTYSGQVTIRKSGTAAAPITLAPAGDGAVTLTSSPPAVSCDSSKPAPDRTLMVGPGADHWTIRGFAIVNGIMVFGAKQNSAYQYVDGLVDVHDWSTRRRIPGRGTNDPVAARNAVSYVSTKVGVPLDPSDGIEILSNTITGRGIHVAMSRYGRIEGNTIHSIKCGTGPAVWIMTLSDGWTVARNYIHDVAASTHRHYMQEGIRVDLASNYNRVESNRVEDLPGDGRAFNTDVDASYNTFSNNVARRVAIGFNDQMSGWGNAWLYNSVADFRTYGFAFRLKDGNLARPSMDTSTYKSVVKCNTATGSSSDLGIGATKGSTFSGNSFSPVWLSRNAQSYWGAEGNTWNGSAQPPSSTPTISVAGC